jgi:hypothetical protein
MRLFQNGGDENREGKKRKFSFFVGAEKSGLRRRRKMKSA